MRGGDDGDGLRANVDSQRPAPGENGRKSFFQKRTVEVGHVEINALIASVLDLVAAACGEFQTWQLMSHGRISLNMAIIGTEPIYSEMRNHIAQAGGRFLNDLDMRLKRRVIFLGDELATQLFAAEPPVGKTVEIRNMPFTVVGVMQDKLQMGTYGGPDELHAVIPLTTFKTLFGRRHLSNLIIKPAEPALMETAKRRMHEVLGAKYRFDPEDERALPTQLSLS